MEKNISLNPRGLLLHISYITDIYEQDVLQIHKDLMSLSSLKSVIGISQLLTQH